MENINLSKQTKNKKQNIKNNLQGWLFISPVVLGILFFTIFPMLSSLVYSFSNYSVLEPISKWGFFNYINAFTRDLSITVNSLGVTLGYTMFSVPIIIILGFFLALLLNNQMLKGLGIFRTLLYATSLLPAVVSNMLWLDLTNQRRGTFSYILQKIGIDYTFFMSNSTALQSYFIMCLFSLGGGIVLWMVQFSSLDKSLYESAELDGAGFWKRTFAITVPLCTPMIYYQLLVNCIATIQTFSTVMLLLKPNINTDALNFFVVRIYGVAFNEYSLGYACALSWILFIIIGLLSLVMIKTSKWVYYAEES